MKKIFLLLFALTTFSIINAQDFDGAIGLRLGGGTGVTYKKMLNQTNSFEVIGGLNLGNNYSNWFYLAGLYQFNFQLGNVDGLNWFAGFGGDVSVRSYETYRDDRGYTKKSDLGIGIDGMIGIDYTIREVPLNISLDWKPTIQLINSGFWGSDVALSVRYTF